MTGTAPETMAHHPHPNTSASRARAGARRWPPPGRPALTTGVGEREPGALDRHPHMVGVDPGPATEDHHGRPIDVQRGRGIGDPPKCTHLLQ